MLKLIPYLFIVLLAFACSETEIKKQEEAAQNEPAIETVPEAKEDNNQPRERVIPIDRGIANADPFYKLVASLKQINYAIKPMETTDGSGKLLGKVLDPLDFWINQRMRSAGRTFEGKSIDISAMQIGKMLNVKGTIDRGGGLYYRATISEWTMTTEEEAVKIIAAIDQLKPKDVIEKSPWVYWWYGNKVYIVVSGGAYMIDEVKKIQAFIRIQIEGEES